MFFRSRSPLQQKASFFFQFAALLDSGLSVQHSLGMAGRDLSQSFQKCLQAIAQTIATGQDLATAIAPYPRYFDRWTVSLVRLAEYSGSLAETSRAIAKSAEQQQHRQKIYFSASLTVISMGVSLVLLATVLFQGNRNYLIRLEFWVFLFILAGLAIVLTGFLTSRRLDTGIYRLLLRIPIVGSLIRIRSILYFTELSLPLSCGVPLLTAVELIRDRIPDPQLSAGLTLAARQIRLGHPLSSSLRGKLAPIALQMVQTGEETGDLDGMLRKVAEYYEGELERILQQLQGILRPLNIVVFGIVVAVLAIQEMKSSIELLPD